MASGLRFVILGAGRSGTSLLAGLLDAHPQVEVGFELFWKRFRDTDGSLGERIRAFRVACDEAARTSTAAVWGNKITTEQLHHLYRTLRDDPQWGDLDAARTHLVTAFLDALHDVVVVSILRDGRAVIRSKLQRAGQPLEKAADWWHYAVQVDALVRERTTCVAVRYEDLLVAPERTLQPVCDALAIEYDPVMLTGTANTKMHERYQRPGLDRSRLDLTGVPPEAEALIRDDLVRAGYL